MFGIGVVLEPGLFSPKHANRRGRQREARVVSRQVGPGGLQVADAILDVDPKICQRFFRVARGKTSRNPRVENIASDLVIAT